MTEATASAPPAPFDTLPLSPASLQVTRELGYTAMTPIQAAALPALLRGEDVVGQSATGSGKTVAFGLPILERVDLTTRRPQALVLCPTRELASQVAATLRTLGRHHAGLRVLVLAGGRPSGEQRRQLQEGAHVLVGTPGRVQDLLDHELTLDELRLLVLDEADRMLDMGFHDEVTAILRQLPRDRQTLLFSATFPEAIAGISRAWQRKPRHVRIDDAVDAAPPIVQVAHLVPSDGRDAALLALLRAANPESGIVFCNFKESVRGVATLLGEAGFAVGVLHGELEQRDRDREIAKLRNGTTRLLVATDVASRGLDISGLQIVVNYEFPPKGADTYTHRIGRTGRAGVPGLAVTLVGSNDVEKLRAREAAAPGTIERRPLPSTVAATPAAPAVALATLFIGGGRKDKLRPGDIVGALTGDAGLEPGSIGKIETHDRFSYVALPSKVVQGLVRAGVLRIKGRNYRVEKVR